MPYQFYYRALNWIEVKTILLPTDFSSNAKNALSYMLSQYEDLPIHLILLNVYYLPHNIQMLIKLEDVLRENSLKSLKKELEFIENQTKHELTQIEIISRKGKSSEIIENIIVEKGVEMVFMGAKGSSDLKDKIMGSNALHIMERTSCPVVLVPNKISCNRKKISMVFMTGAPGNLSSMKELLSTCNIRQTEVLILSVNASGRFLNEQQIGRNSYFKDHFQQLNYSFCPVHNSDVNSGFHDFFELGIPLWVIKP